MNALAQFVAEYSDLLIEGVGVPIVMPAVATLYAALAAVWAWPYADEVVTTITAVDTFLGAVLCISTAQYHKEAGNNG